jgi:deoxyribodipyrimidine photo-lyase
MVLEERLLHSAKRPIRNGRYVLYWVQAAPRLSGNPAYEYAITMADRHDLPLVACFNLIPGYPDATAPQYRFMIEGLLELRQALRQEGVRLIIISGPPGSAPLTLGGDAALVVTDQGYLRHQRDWCRTAADELSCPLTVVETNVVVPVAVASPKEEWSAGTFRKKITHHIDRFLLPCTTKKPDKDSLSLDIGEERDETTESLLFRVISPPSPGQGRIPETLPWKGGERAAQELLTRFISSRLARYPGDRNDPNAGALSDLSPYLHFGQLSPVSIAQQVLASGSPSAPVYLEELIVRRELAVNFVHYNPSYDSLQGLPDWAQKTLALHAGDLREYTYTLQEFATARTHDPYWNAAQVEMVSTGKMHGYMRMYWGKKILEWSETPEIGYQIALTLNNHYELDGRDPSGYAGVAWCFGKHDRAWAERPVFGKVRYMNAAGLRRKFDADRYVARIEALSDDHGS